MPEITLTLFGLLAAMLALGFVLGWILRGGRIAREKTAINSSWQEQMSAQKTEHDRLADQNKSLMEQISEYRASKKDSDLRAKELSSSLKEAFEKRDELQRQLKDARSELDVKVAQRNKLRTDLERSAVKVDAANTALKDKDNKIFKLSRELESWKGRLPPLIERFRLRDLEAQEVEIELEKARSRLADLESPGSSDETRIEPVDQSPVADGLDASNDQYEETSEHAIAALDDVDTDITEEDETDPAYDEDNDAGSGEFTGRFDAQEDDDSTGSHLQADAEDDAPEADSEDESGEFTGRFDARDDDDSTGSHLQADAEDDAPEADSADESGEFTGRFDAHEDDDSTGSHLQAESDDDSPEPDADDHSGEFTGRFDAGNSGDAADEQESAPATTNGAGGPAASKDNLQKIKGVGPAIEKTLNGLGFYRFRQIAEMSEYDIDRVARELRGFRSRIYREDWIGQARMLQVGKSGTYTT